jgi:proline racemase
MMMGWGAGRAPARLPFMRWKQTISLVRVHAEGEVGGVITDGVPVPPGRTMAERANYLEREADHIRRLCLFEPRGSAAMSVNLITPPIDPTADIGMIVMESTDYPAMSGSNAMCTVTAALETGMLAMSEPETIVVLDTPAGLVTATAACRDGKVDRVSLESVPCFVETLDASLEVPGLGVIKVDVAYSGAYFALVDAPGLGISLAASNARELVELGQRITGAAAERALARHPEHPDGPGVSFTHFGGAPSRDEQGRQCRKSAVVIQPGRLDRSPCGTGTMAKLACLVARGEIEMDEDLVHVSPIGTRFVARAIAETTVGGRRAIVPRLSGRAWITGTMALGLDPDDPFPEGFTLPDTWGPGIGG